MYHYSSIQCWPSVALSRTPSSRAASAKFNLSMSRIYGWTETSWVRRTCRTTTYLRTSTATMSCVVYFSFLHYMFWLWYFWCMLLSKINATISITTCKFCWPYMAQGFQLGFTHFPRERIKAIKETCANTKGWIRRLGEGTVQPVCMWGQQGSYRGKLSLEMYIYRYWLRST